MWKHAALQRPEAPVMCHRGRLDPTSPKKAGIARPAVSREITCNRYRKQCKGASALICTVTQLDLCVASQGPGSWSQCLGDVRHLSSERAKNGTTTAAVQKPSFVWQTSGSMSRQYRKQAWTLLNSIHSCANMLRASWASRTEVGEAAWMMRRSLCISMHYSHSNFNRVSARY